MSSKDAKDESSSSKPNEWSGPKADKFDNKATSEYFDPCQEAADRSIRCLKRNGGERAMCSDFFQAYRDCKEQWQNARREAKREARKNKSWFG